MDIVITVLIVAALAALLVKHIRDSKKPDPYGFDGDLPRGGPKDDGPGRSQP